MVSNSDFYLDYDEDKGVFKAFADRPETGSGVLAAASNSLEDLLQQCKQNGLVNFIGMTTRASDEIYRWLTVVQPSLQYIEGLWGSSGPSKRGPVSFRPPSSQSE